MSKKRSSSQRARYTTVADKQPESLRKTPNQHVLAPVAVKLIDEGRKQSHYLIDTLSKTALSLAGGEGAVEKVGVIERLWAMQKEAEERQQEREFGIAKVALAMALPPIPKTKKIEFVDKNNVKRETPYADRGDIESVLEPLCQQHGLSKEYSTETIDGKACQVLTVRHVGGHKEVYRSPYMPLDTTGSKNNNQAAGSTSEYGKRYALIGAFNIIGVDKDDDGNKGETPGSAPKDKFASKVEEQSGANPSPVVDPDLVGSAGARLKDIILNPDNSKRRGEVLMKNLKVMNALEISEVVAHKDLASEIRKLAEEPANG